MKNIVVGIDFSEGSINALKHGISLANHFNADLHLAWCCTPGSILGLSNENLDSLSQKAEIQLKNLVEEYKKQLKNAKINYVLLEGRPYAELTNYAKSLDDAVIVMGSHGLSGFEELFIGSNTTKAITVSENPIFCTRQNIKKHLSDIMVHIDSSVHSLQKMNIACDLAKAYSAKILVVGVVVNDSPENRNAVKILMEKACLKCEKEGVRYSKDFFIVKDSAVDEIIKYAEIKNINLIIVLKNQELEISNFFLGTFTRQLINRCASIPICCIPTVDLRQISR